MQMVYLLFLLLSLLAPLPLTGWNIYNLYSKSPKKPELAFQLTFLIGGFLYFILFGLLFDTAGDWYESVHVMQGHYSISSQYALSFYLPMAVGILGMWILCCCKTEMLPPLVSAFAVAATVIFQVLQITFAIQISDRVLNILELGFFFYLYHANLFIVAVTGVRRLLKQQMQYYKSIKNAPQESEENVVRKGRLYGIVNTFSKYSALIFVCLFFVIAVFEVLFILFGQGADAPVKAFTDTAGWTFSKQISPPSYGGDGHYLCTVAAGGHKKVVKPLRYGMRRGQKIVVNRQLCIANAFEDYIKEKLPGFHKRIRNFYDTYGYPLSKHITTPMRADVVYVLMKPLEWSFLIFLYLFDVKPEERIADQYR